MLGSRRLMHDTEAAEITRGHSGDPVMITRPLVPEQKAAYFPADNKLAHDVSAKAGGFVSFVSLPPVCVFKTASTPKVLYDMVTRRKTRFQNTHRGVLTKPTKPPIEGMPD